MLSSHLDMLAQVARRLDVLLPEVAFVGGATGALYATRPGLGPVRPTDDVDIVVEVTSRVRYHAFAEKLRALEFREDGKAGVLSRWRIEGITVDVMPIDTTILGFSNRWYGLALATAVPFQLTEDLSIRLITAPEVLRTFIAKPFRFWLKDLDFVQSLSGHLVPDAVSQAHAATLLQRIEAIADLA